MYLNCEEETSTLSLTRVNGFGCIRLQAMSSNERDDALARVGTEGATFTASLLLDNLEDDMELAIEFYYRDSVACYIEDTGQVLFLVYN